MKQKTPKYTNGEETALAAQQDVTGRTKSCTDTEHVSGHPQFRSGERAQEPSAFAAKSGNLVLLLEPNDRWRMNRLQKVVL